MKNPPTSPPNNGTPLWRRLPRWAYAVAVLAVLLIGWRLLRDGGAAEEVVTFEAKRGAAFTSTAPPAAP